MLECRAPDGRIIGVPETVDEDLPYFTANELDAAFRHYQDEGFVVIRGLIPAESCDAVRRGFATQLRGDPVPILRQNNMKYERNRFTADGFLENPIFNVQDLQTARFGTFKAAALDILTSEAVSRVSSYLLSVSRVKLVQSMYFEAPAGTWAHQDSYYNDSARGLGNCVAGWFALEDVSAAAGRFYICPRTHKDMPPMHNEGEHYVAAGHQRYKEHVIAEMRRLGFAWVAPALAQGDVLFWNSLTVHGSLGALQPGVSRTSLTAHYLEESDKMLQFHTRIRDQRMSEWNGMRIGMLHDQDRVVNRMMRNMAFHLPGPYWAARALALQVVMAKRRLAGTSRSPARSAVPQETTAH